MVDDKDTTFKVQPTATLEAGKWKVVVSSISDDVGNTAQTLVKNDFEVKGIATVETGFRVLWVVADTSSYCDPTENQCFFPVSVIE